MTDSAVVGEPFRIGACLSKSISAYLSNFVSLNILGLIILVPGGILVFLLFGGTMMSIMSIGQTGAEPTPEMIGSIFITIFGLIFIMLAWQYLLTGAVVYSAVQYLNGEKPSLFASLMQMLRRFVPVVLVAIISTVLVWIGMLLLIVPGVIVALMLCVAIPVVMVEGPGITASLSRSRELTRGSRWKLLGLFLVAGIGISIVTGIFSAVIGLVTPLNETGLVVDLIVEVAMQVIATVFMAVVLAVAYHDLRVAKEGVSTSQIAAVFD